MIVGLYFVIVMTFMHIMIVIVIDEIMMSTLIIIIIRLNHTVAI